MSRSIHVEDISVVKNCPAKWSRMSGNDQVRHCNLCKRNVYNLSNMTREEATGVINEHEGRICVRFKRRKDGKFMTRDCGFAQKSKTGLLTLLAACGSFFVFGPTYAGQMKLSPQAQARLLVKRLERTEESLKEEQAPDIREYLLKQRAELTDQIHKMVEAHGPSILDR